MIAFHPTCHPSDTRHLPVPLVYLNPEDPRANLGVLFNIVLAPYIAFGMGLSEKYANLVVVFFLTAFHAVMHLESISGSEATRL
jgi:hypothetical protein